MTRGQVITFYSYKGGTGRSMALANVACLLAQKRAGPQGVLMIDWDLEAPGLHRFFYDRIKRASNQSITDPHFIELQPGLIDLFWHLYTEVSGEITLPVHKAGGHEQTTQITASRTYEDAEILLDTINLDNYLLEVDIPSENPCKLHLLKAGRFDAQYAARVNTFDWEGLYDRSPWLIRTFAEMLSERYRYILIDSRTGITDTSGICTTLMPEMLVAVFTPNQQSLLGVLESARTAVTYRQKSDDLRPLSVFPLASRIEADMPELRKLWRYGDEGKQMIGYQQQFEKMFEELSDLPQCKLDDYFDQVQIQHVPRYAYGEDIAVLVEQTNDRLSLTESYDIFTNHLVTLSGPWQALKKSSETKEVDVIGDMVRGDKIITGSQDVIIYQNYYSSQIDSESSYLRIAYLNRILDQTSALSLVGIDPKAASAEPNDQLGLNAIYVTLWTTASDRSIGQQTQISVLDALNRNSRLVLLGDPGSGKSTFINYVAMCLAGEGLGHSSINLKLLTQVSDSDSEVVSIQWNHGNLVPIRINLRDFASRGLPKPGERATADHLWGFIADELDTASLGGYKPHLLREIREVGGIVLLDGLDDIPEANHRRIQMKEIISDFAASFPRCRILVSCRIYAYSRQGWRLPGFYETVISPLNENQIDQFIDRFYGYLAQGFRISGADAQRHAHRLKTAISANDNLMDLATRPLLLTLMVSLHAWRGGSLPERRELLYSEVVDLLLDQWERQRIVLDAQGNILLIQPGLAEWLKVERGKIYSLLGKLAYQSHAASDTLVGTSDISEFELVTGLLVISMNPDLKPMRLVEYLSQRSGIIVERGPKIYSFLHRTIQEYLAARYLTDDDYPDKIAELARREPNRWSEVVLLAGAIVARGTISAVWSLVEALCYRDSSDQTYSAEDRWGCLLAGELVTEVINLSEVSPRNQAKIDRVRQGLIHEIRTNNLPARERALAGRVLGKTGDPRPEVIRLDEMQFCFVPAGTCLIGDTVDLKEYAVDYHYFLSRYPVTNAQYEQFIDSGGYNKLIYWQDNETLDSLREKLHRQNSSLFKHLPNNPVVDITWFEAVAFSRWLTQHFQNNGILSPDWIIRLPSEYEWEKAARGGLDIIDHPIISHPKFLTLTNLDPFITNSIPNRRFPWGNEADPDRCNCLEVGIGEICSVGCFSKGASPYGVEDMMGNCFEWTNEQARFDPLTSQEKTVVIKGGDYLTSIEDLECFTRSEVSTNSANNRLGFRITLQPVDR